MLVAVAVAAALGILIAADLTLPVYLLGSSIVLIDGFDMAARLYLRHSAVRHDDYADEPAGKPLPFAILLSIHNMEQELDQLQADLADYRSRVWIIDDASTDATVARLRASGWRHLVCAENRKKPGAIRELLRQLPPEIRTVLVMDPDVRLPRNLAERIHRFQQSGAAALCPKLTIRPDGALAELQHIEFGLSFDLGRHSLSPHTVTSGIAVYDRDALEAAMREHSLSVYGEDLENAVSILGAGKDIVYDPALVVETEGKREFAGWFSQRVGWSFSLLKIYAEHFGDVRRILTRSPMAFYQFGIYFVVLCLVLWPFKILSIALLSYSALNGIDELLALGVIADNALNHPGLFAASYIKYTLLALAAYVLVTPARQVLRGVAFMPFFFLYCVALVIPTSVGYLNWIALRLTGRRIYNDHYDDNPVLGRNRSYV